MEQVKDSETIGNINDIIGVKGGKKENEEGIKTPGKTSIMTTSTGKTLKRKQDGDAVKNEIEEDCFTTENAVPEKILVLESLEAKSEITITAIPKKFEGKELEAIPIA